MSETVTITPEMIDRGARHLRETTQAVSVAWESVPKGAKKKWLVLSEGVLRAALGEPAHV